MLASVSRLANRVSGPETNKAVANLRRQMALYAENEDMITVGAYQKGSNPLVDAAIDAHPAIEEYLIQGEYELSPIDKTLLGLAALGRNEIPQAEMEQAGGAKGNRSGASKTAPVSASTANPENSDKQ